MHVQVQVQAQGLLVGTRPGSRSCSWLWGGRFAVPRAALSCGCCNELQHLALVPVHASGITAAGISRKKGNHQQIEA